MKSIKKVIYSFAFALLCLFIIQTGRVHAAGATFTVQPEHPANQIDKSATYYDLLVQPGQKQDLTFEITNLLNKPQKFTISPTVSATNGEGQIIYDNLTDKRDSSLKVDFTKLSGMKKHTYVTVPANAKKEVTISYTVPTKPFKGYVLGSIFVQGPKPKVDKTKGAKGKTSMTIKNRFGYAMAVGMRESEKTGVKPNVKITKVIPTQGIKNPAIAINLQNDQPVYFMGYKTTARITKRGSNQTLHKRTGDGMQMAPNSNFNYLVDWGNNALVAGDYTAYVTIKSPQTKQTFHLKRNFTITPDEANRINAKFKKLKRNYLWLWILIGVLIFLLIVLLFVWFYHLGRKREKNTN